ncbi:unnamed protein product [Victoria cruziana]
MMHRRAQSEASLCLFLGDLDRFDMESALSGAPSNVNVIRMRSSEDGDGERDEDVVEDEKEGDNLFCTFMDIEKLGSHPQLAMIRSPGMGRRWPRSHLMIVPMWVLARMVAPPGRR